MEATTTAPESLSPPSTWRLRYDLQHKAYYWQDAQGIRLPLMFSEDYKARDYRQQIIDAPKHPQYIDTSAWTLFQRPDGCFQWRTAEGHACSPPHFNQRAAIIRRDFIINNPESLSYRAAQERLG